MNHRHILPLIPANRAMAIRGIDAAIEKTRYGGRPWTMEVREGKRTDEQNKAVHGLIGQILKQRPMLHGLRMSMEAYKAIFMHAIGRETKMLPTLEGDGFFPMGLSTSALTVGEFRDLIEFILAWCAREEIAVEHFDDERVAA